MRKKRLATNASKIFRLILIGIIVGFLLFGIYRLGGLPLLSSVGGVAGTTGIAWGWDIWKKAQEDQESREREIDARFDLIEQRLPGLLSVSDYQRNYESMMADVAVLRATAERASQQSREAHKMASNSSDRIMDIVTSGVIFQLTQQVTALRIQVAILKRSKNEN